MAKRSRPTASATHSVIYNCFRFLKNSIWRSNIPLEFLYYFFCAQRIKKRGYVSGQNRETNIWPWNDLFRGKGRIQNFLNYFFRIQRKKLRWKTPKNHCIIFFCIDLSLADGTGPFRDHLLDRRFVLRYTFDLNINYTF